MAKLPSVYKRAGSPVYWGSVMTKGKRKQVAICENKAAAQRMLAEIKEQSKSRSKYGAASWASFKERYIDWSRAYKSKITQGHDRRAFGYFEEFAHPKFLDEIDVPLVEEFQSWLKNTAEKLAASYNPKKDKRPIGLMGNETINRMVRALKCALRKGAEWGMIAELKLDRVKKFKTPRGRIEFFSPKDVSLLLKHADQKAKEHGGYCPYKTATLLGCRAGLRRGEMIFLEWSDINFKKSILTVQPKTNWTPKTNECRDIPLSKDLMSFLSRLPKSKKTNRVLYDYYGDPFTLDGIVTKYARFVKGAGLKGSLHTLRHTFASHLVQAGVDLYTVSKLLGHSSIKTTEIYAHLSPVTLSGAVAKLPKV